MTTLVMDTCAVCGQTKEMFGMYEHRIIKLCENCCRKVGKGIMVRDIDMIDHGKPVTIRVFGTLDGWGIEPDEQVKKFALELGWKWDLPCFTKVVNPENFKEILVEADRIRQKIYRRTKKLVMKRLERGYLTHVLSEEDIPSPFNIPLPRYWKVVYRQRRDRKFQVLIIHEDIKASHLAAEMNSGAARNIFGFKLGDIIRAEDNLLVITTSFPDHWRKRKETLTKILPGKVVIRQR